VPLGRAYRGPPLGCHARFAISLPANSKNRETTWVGVIRRFCARGAPPPR
jgi:hypothetical protein